LIDIQARGTIPRTRQTIGTPVRLCLQAQGRPPKDVPEPSADDYKRRHPAEVVAACPPAKGQGETQEEGDDDIVGRVPEILIHCQPAFQIIERIYGVVATGLDGYDGNDADPRYPDDDPLDPVGLGTGGRFVIDACTEFYEQYTTKGGRVSSNQGWIEGWIWGWIEGFARQERPSAISGQHLTSARPLMADD
jgi:hypothetical protein